MGNFFNRDGKDQSTLEKTHVKISLKDHAHLRFFIPSPYNQEIFAHLYIFKEMMDILGDKDFVKVQITDEKQRFNVYTTTVSIHSDTYTYLIKNGAYVVATWKRGAA
jgi:hypothetical protein